MPRRPPGVPNFDARLLVSCYRSDLDRWQDVAAKAGVPLSEAVRRVLEEAWPKPRRKGNVSKR